MSPADGRLLSFAAEPAEMKLYIVLHHRSERLPARVGEVIAALEWLS